ncbi:hypothetical protein Q8A67_016005 [Cirrhinus molitorella]|uniref:Uncharacterized protein n=1 Tax=Cirrhinus molitorella TaxID=172907 RepID=A0AA88PJM7_9TELE|nr:hypothetical protein Q8A67_016005 [Cirrhinus molitorella]
MLRLPNQSLLMSCLLHRGLFTSRLLHPGLLKPHLLLRGLHKPRLLLHGLHKPRLLLHGLHKPRLLHHGLHKPRPTPVKSAASGPTPVKSAASVPAHASSAASVPARASSAASRPAYATPAVPGPAHVKPAAPGTDHIKPVSKGMDYVKPATSGPEHTKLAPANVMPADPASARVKLVKPGPARAAPESPVKMATRNKKTWMTWIIGQTQVQTWHAGTFSDRDNESVAVRSLTPFSPPYEEERASMIDANEEQAPIDEEDEEMDRDVLRATSDRHELREFAIKSGGKKLPFIVKDVMGLESKVLAGAQPEDIINAVFGHVKHSYKFDEKQAITDKDSCYTKDPKLSDQSFCLVYVIAADTIQLVDDQLTNKLKIIRQRISDQGIPQVIVLTKVDEACPLVQKIYRRSTLARRSKRGYMEMCHMKTGVPLTDIFPVKNYHNEIETDDGIDVLILKALEHIVQNANDRLDDSEMY